MGASGWVRGYDATLAQTAYTVSVASGTMPGSVRATSQPLLVGRPDLMNRFVAGHAGGLGRCSGERRSGGLLSERVAAEPASVHPLSDLCGPCSEWRARCAWLN